MGVNSGLRVQDLLALKIGDVKDVKIGERITLREKKTGKENVFVVNKEIKSALDAYLVTVKDLLDALHTFQVDDGFYLHLSLQFPFFFQGVENRAYKPAPQGSSPRAPAITA
jgi:integrase